MSLYPQLQINQIKFRHNVEQIATLMNDHHLKFHAVTKCYCAYEPMLRIQAESGIRDFADSRLENFERINKYSESSLLLRVPMISEAASVVRLCDVSLNSEWDSICAISDAAVVQNKKHGIILMVELGDRREGLMPEEVPDMVHRIMNLRGVRLAGFGANFNCYGGVIPDRTKLETLRDIAREVEARYCIELDYVSGGNSGSLHLLEDHEMPAGINHLRLGEVILLGRETSYGHRVMDLAQDVFTVRAEVIESRRKPSLPEGNIGLNALGERVYFEDRGMIRRVILALGNQDVRPSGLTPLLKGVDFLGGSSDHLIYDVTSLTRDLAVGDHLDFEPNYAALNALFTSAYVHKVMV